MNKVNLFYWNNLNFGDELSPAIIEEFSGIKVQYKNIGISRKDRINAFVKIDNKLIKTIYFPWQKLYSSIGSILSWLPKGTIVWGSGFMNSNEKFKGGQILAVRGKLTEKKLNLQGYTNKMVYGDPALLLPLWIRPTKIKTNRVGIIPHWSEFEYFNEQFGSKYCIIDLRSDQILKIVELITSCEYILSSSLHGVIVAHAYNIPALWIKHGGIGTDGFKFHDYFSSVEIPEYNGFENIDELLGPKELWKEKFKIHPELTLINNSLDKIQFNLLKSLPFGLSKKYQQILQQNNDARE